MHTVIHSEAEILCGSGTIAWVNRSLVFRVVHLVPVLHTRAN